MATRMKRDPVADLMGKCVHFTGIMNPTCSAGVAYEAIRVVHEPITYTSGDGREYKSRGSLPCNDRLNYCGATCPKRETPPRDVAERQIAEQNAEIEMTLNGLAAVARDAEKVKGGTGTVPCPKCGGVLHWSKAESNGHIWGKCETAKCLSWMM